jgi:hypothetical protein
VVVVYLRATVLETESRTGRVGERVVFGTVHWLLALVFLIFYQVVYRFLVVHLSQRGLN